MEKVYAVISINVEIPIGVKSAIDVVGLMADVMENCHRPIEGRGYKGNLVRLYKNLEEAQNEVSANNAWVFRRAAEGIRGDHGGSDLIEYIREIEVV